MSIYSAEIIGRLNPSVDICRGISIAQIEQLTAFSVTDPLVTANTRDFRRFFPLASADEYINDRNRQIYTLTTHNLLLAGIFWIRPVPDDQKIIASQIDPNLNQFTFAARIYPPLRGKHLSAEFISASLNHYAGLGHSGFTWAEIKETNIPSIRMCQKANCSLIDCNKPGKVFVGKNI